MKGLKKRVDTLEQTGKRKEVVLPLSKTRDGGYRYEGAYYENAEALRRALGIDEQDMLVLVINDFE